MPRRVLITGATGVIGPSIVRTFHDEGFMVRTFSLDPPHAGMFPNDVENLVGDITDPEGVAAATVGIDCVVHMAAMLHIDNPTPSLDSVYERINVEGTSNVVTSCKKANVQRIVFFSTSMVYGPSKGGILSEDTPPRPLNSYAKTKLAGENLVLAARGQDGFALGTVLRLSAVYGSRVKGNYRRLVQALARRRFVAVGRGNNRRTLVHDRDVAQAAFLAATNPIAAGRTYNVTDGQIYTMKEILAVLSRLIGRRPPQLAIPTGLARLAAGTLELGTKVLGKPSSVTRATLDKYIEDVPVSCGRIISELGFSPRFDLARGWAEVLQEMRKADEI